eukprot:458680-Pleurochrysis_carterae.AAC.1
MRCRHLRDISVRVTCVAAGVLRQQHRARGRQGDRAVAFGAEGAGASRPFRRVRASRMLRFGTR